MSKINVTISVKAAIVLICYLRNIALENSSSAWDMNFKV